jgi:C-terminal processing protease CtpA/Prc
MRLGAFAPQYDPVFNKVSELAEKEPGATEDSAMLAGFCAVVSRFVVEYDNLADKADVMVLDLRGNMGGFGREARLLSAALTRTAPPPTFDVFASGKPGVLKLVAQPDDPLCTQVSQHKPLIVLTDGGTRSAGELMSAWMWTGGALLAGERTIGAGGGFEFGSSGFKLAQSGFNVRISGNFTFFDQSGQLRAGETDEQALLDVVASDAFAPSHKRPFAIQSAGMKPDLASASTLSDLQDGGVAQVTRLIAEMKRQGWIKDSQAAK